MQMRGAFVAGIGSAAFQPVMLDIIDDFQSCGGEYALRQEKQQSFDTRYGKYR